MSGPETMGGSYTAFVVQAKTNGAPVAVSSGQIFDGEWRTVRFAETETGVHVFCPQYFAGLMNYEAAQAMRWWFIANTHPNPMITRLVPYAVKYSAEKAAQEPIDEIGTWLSRNSP